MTSVYEETDALLEDHPEREQALHALLELDSTEETWAFTDADVDSGTFGDLVSRGIVEKVDGEYRLSNPDAIAAALEGEEYDESEASGRISLPSLSLADTDTVLVASVVGLLALTFLMRTAFSWGGIFRGEQIVLLGNDPYLYRYWVEELLRTDPTLGTMPAPVPKQDVLMVALMWGGATLLGGTKHDAGLVLAWYPVVASLITAGLVYTVTAEAFGDKRISVASLAVFAVTPVVSYRAALGFGDHHALDYIWVGTAVLGLVLLSVEQEDWRTPTARRLSGVLALAVALAATVHTWRAGPLLLLPIALFIVLRTASDIRSGQSPVAANVWYCVGLGLGAVLAAIPHFLYGWSGPYRVVSPALLFAGSIAVLAIGEIAYQRNVSGKVALGAEIGGGVLVAIVAYTTIPAVKSAVLTGSQYFATRASSGIAETYSLFSPAFGGFVGPILFFGLAFFFGVGALVWTTWKITKNHQPAWVILVAYTWSFLVASIIQVRFAGQLAIVLAIFSGLSFVYLAHLTDVTDIPRPFVVANEEVSEGRERFHGTSEGTRTLTIPGKQGILAVGLLFILVSGMGFVQTPIKTGQLAISSSTYDAATATNQYAEQENVDWPQNYVLSDWGRNRVYNYFVNGHSRSYAYAKEHYGEFLLSTNSTKWTQKLREDNVGFVVLQDIQTETKPDSMQATLWKRFGSYGNDTRGLGQFRAIYANGAKKVFEVVPGARITGTASPNTTTTVTHRVTIPGAEFTYTRKVETNQYGEYGIAVPYPGTYSLFGDQKRVGEMSVDQGQVVGNYYLHLPFDEGAGTVATDPIGNRRVSVDTDSWTRGVRESAVSFREKSSSIRVDDGMAEIGSSESLTVAFWVKGDLSDSPYQYPTAVTTSGQTSQIWVGARKPAGTFGVQVTGADGTTVRNYAIEETNFEEWTLVVAVLDRDDGELKLYRNGTLVGNRDAARVGEIREQTLYIGGHSKSHRLSASVDDVRVYTKALTEEEIDALYRNMTTR